MMCFRVDAMIFWCLKFVRTDHGRRRQEEHVLPRAHTGKGSPPRSEKLFPGSPPLTLQEILGSFRYSWYLPGRSMIIYSTKSSFIPLIDPSSEE